MFLKLRSVAITAIATIALSCTAVMAADYDEAVDGDLGDLTLGPTIFNVEPGTNTVSGTVGDTDFEDFVAFTIEPGETLLSVTVDDFVFAFGNTSTGFRLYTDQGAGYVQASSGIFTDDAIGVNYLDTWDLSAVGGSAPLPAGDYGVLLAEFTAGQQYTFSLDVSAVPEPSGLGMLTAAGMALLLLRRRSS